MYFKVLTDDGRSCNGGNAQWSLPIKNDDGTWTPGEWMPDIEGELVPCENGYHLCREKDLIYWLNKAIFEAEYGGEIVEADDKIVVRRARLLRRIETWNDKTARLFACWCARQIWHLLTDERSRTAVEVAERYANGKATQQELAAARAAAWNAARAAARDAAWAAAWNAAGDAAGDAAWDAARAAARDAAWAAAWDAAGDAAWDAARDAQTKQLLSVLGLE
jgi:hypothetical protein